MDTVSVFQPVLNQLTDEWELLLVFGLFWVGFFFMLTFWSAFKKYRNKPPHLQWWQKGVVYEVYVRSFNDSNNDGCGDIRGIINKIDYFKSIGVNILWLTPIYPSGGKDGGYDVTSYTDIDPVYGSMKDFDELVTKLHQNGKKWRQITVHSKWTGFETRSIYFQIFTSSWTSFPIIHLTSTNGSKRAPKTTILTTHTVTTTSGIQARTAKTRQTTGYDHVVHRFSSADGSGSYFIGFLHSVPGQRLWQLYVGVQPDSPSLVLAPVLAVAARFEFVVFQGPR